MHCMLLFQIIALLCIFYSILNQSWPSQEKNQSNQGMKVQVKGAFESNSFFVTKNNKKAD